MTPQPPAGPAAPPASAATAAATDASEATDAANAGAAGIRDSIDAAATRGGISLDEHQRVAAAALARFGATLSARRDDTDRATTGFYLFGPVGRGKTWLADAFFDAVPLPAGRKRRLHFHSFYRRLHRDLYRDGAVRSGHASAIDTAIDDLLEGIDLLYFDEFHLHDAGDATLALRVLRELLARRIPLLATSNYAPGDLLPDEMFHHLFEPGIELIEGAFSIVTVAGVTDYRRGERADAARLGFARGSWQRPGLLTAPEPDRRSILHSDGHRITARQADDAVLWLTFDQACEAPTATGDFLAWAAEYPRWVIEGVPRLTDCTPQARQRFLNLVDVLNDQGVEADFISELTPDGALEGGSIPTARGAAADREELGLGLDGMPIDVARTASRLALLRRLG